MEEKSRLAERSVACEVGLVARGEANEIRDVDWPVKCGSVVVRQESAELLAGLTQSL